MILVAEQCGLCEGAARALRITEEQLRAAQRPIVLYNHLLHNPAVMRRLQAHGVQTVHDVADVPGGALVIVSAHGMPKANYELLAARGIPCVDATCPKVISIHRIVEEGCAAGKAVVVIGKKNHPEVLGTAGWCEGAVVVQSEDDLPALRAIAQEKVLVVSQSTSGVRQTNALAQKIRDMLPGKEVEVRSTICPAQRHIQQASVEMAEKCDFVFVLGGHNSSNTVELFELCKATGTPCWHVESLADFYACLCGMPLDAAKNYGLTAGASTTKEEIENGRCLLAYMLFQREAAGQLAAELDSFNAGLGHQNQTIDCFLHSFAAVNRGGKNIRGTLVALGYKLAGGEDVAASRPLGLAVELFQTAILVHDDIIDHADMRRGLPTVPAQFRARYKGTPQAADVGNSIGICAGDVGFYLANALLCSRYATAPQFPDVMSYFSQMALNTMYGEVLDVVLPFEARQGLAQGPRQDSVMEIYRLKTAWYSVAGPLCLGMLLAGASQGRVRPMEELAIDLGIAFQIKDDLMGIFSEEIDLGKPMSDIAEYKQTLLYAYVHDKRPEFSPELEEHYGRSPLAAQDVAAVRALFTQSGAKACAEETMDSLFCTAREKLERLDFLAEEDAALLRGFCNYLQFRTK